MCSAQSILGQLAYSFYEFINIFSELNIASLKPLNTIIASQLVMHDFRLCLASPSAE